MRRHAPDGAHKTSDLWQTLPPIFQAAVDTVIGVAVSNTQWDEFTPDLRGRTICEALHFLVETIARRHRTVLLIEDMHWIDSASGTGSRNRQPLALPPEPSDPRHQPAGCSAGLARRKRR